MKDATDLASNPTILFAGGGSGGHIFPNLAVIECLRQQGVAFTPRLIISHRLIDRQIAKDNAMDYTVVPARPLSASPVRLLATALFYLSSKALVRKLIREHHAVAVVGTGGFVSGPALAAAVAAGIPAAMVNLDAVPGRANRMMARKATDVFSAYDVPDLRTTGKVRRIGVPLRPAVLRRVEPDKARAMLGLDPARLTLLITAGSQGARSINALMIRLTHDTPTRDALASWQVIHQSGQHDGDELRAAYDAAGIPARVEPFIDDMGLAWSAADLSISRAGAGSAAEVWARAVPTLFLPYPFHKDQHQRLNALPLVEAGGAVLEQDRVEPEASAAAIGPVLTQLLTDAGKRSTMRSALSRSAPGDGGRAIADWLADLIRRG